LPRRALCLHLQLQVDIRATCCSRPVPRGRILPAAPLPRRLSQRFCMTWHRLSTEHSHRPRCAAADSVAAHSTTRNLFKGFTGALYQLKRASDGAVFDVPTGAYGYADVAVHHAFCMKLTNSSCDCACCFFFSFLLLFFLCALVIGTTLAIGTALCSLFCGFVSEIFLPARCGSCSAKNLTVPDLAAGFSDFLLCLTAGAAVST
jgi:hypothetical protein